MNYWVSVYRLFLVVFLFLNDWFKKFSFFILLEKYFKRVTHICLIISNVSYFEKHDARENGTTKNTNADYNNETLHTVCVLLKLPTSNINGPYKCGF